MKKISKEVDLYVSLKKMTNKESQELSDFIAEYKLGKENKTSKPKKTKKP